MTGHALQAALPSTWPSWWPATWRRMLVPGVPALLLLLVVGAAVQWELQFLPVLAVVAVPLALTLSRPWRQRLLLARAAARGRVVVRHGTLVDPAQAPAHLRNSSWVLREAGGRCWSVTPYRGAQLERRRQELAAQPALIVWAPGPFLLRASALVVGNGAVAPLVHLPYGQVSRDEQRKAAERKARARWADGGAPAATGGPGRLLPGALDGPA